MLQWSRFSMQHTDSCEDNTTNFPVCNAKCSSNAAIVAEIHHNPQELRFLLGVVLSKLKDLGDFKTSVIMNDESFSWFWKRFLLNVGIVVKEGEV